MKKEHIEYFKDMLNNQLEELLKNADTTVLNLMNTAESSADFLDLAALDSFRNYTLRMRDRESRLIVKIVRSLKDIEEGIYGLCEVCGEEISLERMKARPVTTFCIQCKTKKESQEKAVGR